MGNDGGSIPTRRELVKEAARNPTASEVKESLQEQQGHLWNIDPLSERPLARPIVSDSLGRLFNKDSVIEFLLPSEDGNFARKVEQAALLQGAVKSLKDVVEVLFEVEEAAAGDPMARRDGIFRTEKWICPVTQQELGAGAKAVYLVPCGHVFSSVAVKEVSGEHCWQCNEPYASNDIIPILPTLATDIARLTLRMKTLKEKGLSHSLKKASSGGKKRKKNLEETSQVKADTSTTQIPGIIDVETSKGTSKQSTPQPQSGTATPKLDGIKNASTALLTAKVLVEQEERNKRRKMDKNDTISSLFSSGPRKGKDIDFMNRGFAIPSKR